MKKMTSRDKSIFAGLYLSKFDLDGVRYLGFENFIEAFNVIGLALGVQPASVKNYRDEFDPLFPNARMGWHKRPTRKYCKDIYDAFHDLDLVDFSKLLKKLIYKGHELEILIEDIAKLDGDKDSSFAKRLITGQAAEQYFKETYLSIDKFKDLTLEDTTKVGCGFDFKLSPEQGDCFWGVEVKGLNESNGNIALTNKEHAVAYLLKERYFIFVVKNFKEKPFHDIYQDPINTLKFNKIQNQVVQISWQAPV